MIVAVSVSLLGALWVLLAGTAGSTPPLGGPVVLPTPAPSSPSSTPVGPPPAPAGRDGRPPAGTAQPRSEDGPPPRADPPDADYVPPRVKAVEDGGGQDTGLGGAGGDDTGSGGAGGDDAGGDDTEGDDAGGEDAGEDG